MFQDLRFAARGLLRQPALAAIAILTLALAIGANTAIFTVVNSLLLRPLPYPESDRLVRVHTAFRSNQSDRYWMSRPEYFELVRDARSYSSTAAWAMGTATFGNIDRPVRVAAAYTTPGLAATLGVAPALGRYFTAEEAQPGADPQVAVLGHDLWQRAFGADPQVIGRKVTLDGHPVRIIGVMPDGFEFPDPEIEAWVPFGLDPRDPKEGRASHFLHVVGRLAPGVSLDAARAELSTLTASWSRLSSPTWHTVDTDEHPVTVHALRGEVIGAARRAALAPADRGAVRAAHRLRQHLRTCSWPAREARSREIAVRAALGAGRAAPGAPVPDRERRCSPSSAPASGCSSRSGASISRPR